MNETVFVTVNLLRHSSTDVNCYFLNTKITRNSRGMTFRNKRNYSLGTEVGIGATLRGEITN